ncbi:MAG TPA: 4-hydroxy-tetrahydrodipicolinate synthase [Candidatus Avibacteroides faecavium]|mgnify:CR=1 FL=1|nr:4-hydroxy-tetrahydrodipicolinate synthase [Candidatus Avibacteroides faecavium]
MDNRIKGLGTALVTPFTEDGRVDYDGLGKLIDYQIDNGVDFLCVLGTTGEAATLSADEKEGVIDYSIERIGRRVPILLGCSSNNTVDLGKEISRYSRYDVDAMLSVVPFYNKPTQEGIVKHYEYISGCTDKGLVMYNVPSRTGVNMTAETTLRIAEDCKNVIAVKEASGNIRQVNAIIKSKREGFHVLSGDDFLTYPLMTLGADGVISVISNGEPRLFADMVHHLANKEYEKALNIHNSLFDLYELLFRDGNPAGIKAALNCKGLINNVLRLPLTPVSQKVYDAIERFQAGFAS